MADLAMPLESVDQDVVADGAITRGVTVGEVALGGAGVIEEAGERNDREEKIKADAFAVDAVTSVVSRLSIL